MHRFTFNTASPPVYLHVYHLADCIKQLGAILHKMLRLVRLASSVVIPNITIFLSHSLSITSFTFHEVSQERGEIGELADPIPDNPTKSQGVLKGDTFTIVTPDGMELPLKYYPANSSFDLGYGGLTDRSFPVLYGETKNREHVFTFALDPYSAWNVDSGLIKNAGEYAK